MAKWHESWRTTMPDAAHLFSRRTSDQSAFPAICGNSVSVFVANVTNTDRPRHLLRDESTFAGK